MALATFNPSIKPSPGTGIKLAIKLLEAEFGDGYSQTLPDGINHIKKTLSLKWDILDDAQVAEIFGFFTTQGGYIPFLYQPVGEAAPIKWRCKEWTRDRPAAGWTMSATLVQDFTNVV